MPHSVELPLDIHEPLEKFLLEHLDLPVLPEAASRIIQLCEDPDSDPRDIQTALERDPSLAAQIMRIANSALFAPVEPISSLQNAVSRLGMTTIRNLSLAAALQGPLFTNRQHEQTMRAVWKHSALTAVFARDVARRVRVSGEVAFLWGLMHDVGRPLVLQAAVERPDLLGCGSESPQLLEAAMDAFHGRVGARLVRAWGLPYPIAQIVGWHHDPEEAGEHARGARITRVADLLAHWALEDGLGVEDFPRDDPALVDLGLPDSELDEILALRQQAILLALGLG